MARNDTEPTVSPTEGSYASEDDLHELVITVSVLTTILFLLFILVGLLIFFLWRKVESHRREIAALRDDVDRVRKRVAAVEKRPLEDGRMPRMKSYYSTGPDRDSGPTVHFQPDLPSIPPSPHGSYVNPAATDLEVFRTDMLQYGVSFLDQKVDVFQSSARGMVALPGLYKNVQSYFDRDPSIRQLRQSMVATDFPSLDIENIKVVPLYKQTHATIAEVPSVLVGKGRPKSLFVSAAESHMDKSLTSQSMSGMFVTETIGPAGGSLSVYGVSLKIPAGALPEEQEIRLGIVWDASHQPTLDTQTALLSHVVSCEPHGLRFEKPVTLTLPHCAHAGDNTSLESAWEFNILESETPLDSSPNWKTSQTNGATNGDLMITKTHVSFSLRHFTLYTYVGKASSSEREVAKRVLLVAFAPPLNTSDFFRITVFCVNDYTIEELKGDMGGAGSQQDSKKPILFHNSGKNMRVLLDEVPTGWKIQGKSTKELDFELVWHGEGPNCCFVLKPLENQSEIFCEVVGFQIDRDKNKQIIEIAQRKQVQETPRRSNTKLVFHPRLRDKIVILLDPPHVEGRDWRMLAEKKLHKRWEDIRYYETLTGHERGPTYRLLEEWENRGYNLKEFKDTMEDIQRFDVAEEVGQFLPNNTSGPGSAGTTSNQV